MIRGEVGAGVVFVVAIVVLIECATKRSHGTSTTTDRVIQQPCTHTLLRNTYTIVSSRCNRGCCALGSGRSETVVCILRGAFGARTGELAAAWVRYAAAELAMYRGHEGGGEGEGRRLDKGVAKLLHVTEMKSLRSRGI